MTSSNPIEQHEDGTWWFWDEVWVNLHGPFDTKEDCEETLQDYIEWLDQEDE